MGRTICLCLLACLAVGLAVPVPESTSPGNEQDLKNLILSANPEDNDISGSPKENQVTAESEDAVIIDSAAITEKKNEDPIEIEADTTESYATTSIEIAADTTESYAIASPKEVEEPAIAPKVNQTELPKATTTLEPTDESTTIVTDEELRDQQILDIIAKISHYQETFEDDSQVIRKTEDQLNEDDLVDVIPYENQETFEDNSQVFQITEGLPNEDDLIDVIPYDNQETIDDDSQIFQITEGLLNEDDLVDVIPEENQETLEDDSQVIQITEGLLNEDDLVYIIPNENPETFEDAPVMPVFGSEIPFEGEQIVPETDEQMPSEEEREVIIAFDEMSPFMPNPDEVALFEGEKDEELSVFPEGDEIFIIEDQGFFPTLEEEEEDGSFLSNIGEEQMVPTFNDFEEDMAFVPDENDEMFALPMPEDPYFPEEPFINPSNDDSMFGIVPVDVQEEPVNPADVAQTMVDAMDNPYAYDDVSDSPFANYPSPSEYYIPNESSSDGVMENDEFSAFPENENESFIDVSDVVLNEPIPMRNDNETPAMDNILMIKTKSLMSEGRPTIEIINTDFPQIPPEFAFGSALPVNDNQEPENYEIPEYTQDDGTFINDSELPEQSGLLTPNMLARQPIIFPEEFVPNRWTEENFYEPPRMQSQNPVPFEPFAYSSYSKYSSNRIPGSSYGSPALQFNPYGPSQDQSFSVPNPHQQNFVEEQSEDMNGMMNDDMQSQMPSTMPFSSPSDVSIFDYEDTQENEEQSHFHLTDDVPQDSRFSNFPNRFDSFMDSMMPTREDISQDFHGPNTFPLNFRNPNVDGENTDINDFINPFQTDRSQGLFQQNQQYDARPSFSPYQSRYNVLSGDQPSRFDSRYPIVGQPNPFNSYGPFDVYYSPYDNYNLFRSPGLYSNRPMKRYSMNYRFNYPTPLW